MSVGAIAPPAPTRPQKRLSPARLGVAGAALAGLAVAVAVVGWFGAGRILLSISRVGVRGFGLYAGYSLMTFGLTGGAWWVLAVGQPLRRWPLFAFGRLLRESAADILPFASIGGVLVGARGVSLRGVPAATAYGSLALELVTEIIAQIAFMALGLTLLSARLGGDARAGAVELAFAIATGVLALAIGGMLVAQRRGFDLLGRLIGHLLPNAGEGLQGVHEAVADLHRRPLRLLASVALHFAGWAASAVGSWIALRLMGAPVSIPAVIAIESLMSAVKSAAFAVPNAVGVQEAAYALLGQLFGLTGDMGVALSLLRRAKDLALGAPALLAWQALEGRRLLRRA
jgi:glycosyltransferase 2 family protein